ncbi:hypothetical protein Efla_002418 [Eimeria flavescens]
MTYRLAFEACIAGKEWLDLRSAVSQDNDVSDENSPGKLSLQFSAAAKTAVFLGPRSQGRQALRNWASTLSVLIILAVVMISLCLRASKNLVRGGPAPRRLAREGEEEDSDDAMLDSILEDCLDMEEAAGWPSHHGAPTALVPLAATAQEFTAVPLAVSTGFSIGPGAPPSASAPQAMPGVLTSTSGSMVADQLQPLGSVLSEGTARTSFFTPVSTAPLPSIPPEDASGFLLLSQLSADSWLESIPYIMLEWHGLQGEAKASGFQEMLEDYAQPSASAGLMGETSTEAELSPSTQSAHTRLMAEDHMEAAGEDTMPSVQTEAKEDEPSSAYRAATAAQATDPSPSIPKELRNQSMHPFVRLPIVRPEAILRDFNPQWSKPIFGRIGQQMLLSRIRERLLKPELDAAEVEQLMLETEKLVRITSARARQGAAPQNPWLRIRHLGNLFLILDAVVSVREVLGPRMAASRWWENFVNSFPTDYEPTKARAGENIMMRTNHKLVSRLLAAIKIYKTGVRPHSFEVLKLKRMLLCSPYSINWFKHHRFDAWRKDDAKFRQAQGELSEDFTDEEDD